MKKLRYFVMGVVLIASFTLTGCSADSGASSGKIVLNMAWWGSAPRANATIKAIKEFEKAHPNIEVKTAYQGFNGYWEKMGTQISGGNGPDVMQQDVSTIAGYAQKGALLPLDKKIIKTASIDSTVLKTGVINGKLYGIPSGIEGVAVFYNPNLLKKAGVEIKPNQQITWTQFAQMANQVKQKLDGVYGTSDEVGDEVAFQNYLRGKGENEYTTNGKLGFKQQSLIDWLDYWAELRKSGAAPSATFTASQANVATGNDAFATGKTPFHFGFSGDSVFTDYESYLKHSLGMMMSPTLDDGKEVNYPRPTMYWSVNAGTKHPKQAQELVNYLTNNVTAGKILGLQRGVPVSSKVAETVHKSLPKNQETAWNAIQAELKVARPMSPLAPSAASQITTLFGNITQKNAFGKISSTQAANEFFTKAKTILNNPN
ncbi:ABC transporter substrate-binding protein [Pullulanibacillus camelliae]|uniref:ABC transporter substrate-binding protein n=1 Tax=Pullulanibacillus camelliae TaxID=1707096 RepID=A0A8J2VIK1_9BACL|nr:sugar ABC transporter substrate-binding protein [Pullulanibacillus camelliae]GGE26150.1 ABC transporter substrate-binding protein [Pullulanibacillus camelliae]